MHYHCLSMLLTSCSSLLCVHLIKCADQKELREGRSLFGLHFHVKTFSAGCKGRKSGRRLQKKPSGNTAYWFFPAHSGLCSASFPAQLRTTCPGTDCIHSVLCCTSSVLNPYTGQPALGNSSTEDFLSEILR